MTSKWWTGKAENVFSVSNDDVKCGVRKAYLGLASGRKEGRKEGSQRTNTAMKKTCRVICDVFTLPVQIVSIFFFTFFLERQPGRRRGGETKRAALNWTTSLSDPERERRGIGRDEGESCDLVLVEKFDTI